MNKPSAESDHDEMLSLEQAASLLCVSKSTLYRMNERGEIRGRKVGRQWRFSRPELQTYLDRGPHAVVVSSVGSADIDALIQALVEPAKRVGWDIKKANAADTSEVKLADFAALLVSLSVKHGASDIHVSPERDAGLVQIRVDGVLIDLCRLPLAAYPAVVAQLKTMASLIVDEQSLPQDGRFQVDIDEQRYDVRVAVMPTIFGETLVMRILNAKSALVGLDKIFSIESDLDKVRGWLGSSHGLILCTGPTGSGKTTTLYGCVNEVASPQKSTVTVEDPVEFQLPNTRQTGINTRVGLTFPQALRALLRQDPDIIMVGELRDKDSAVLLIQAALTGHLVLAQMHTMDAASTAVRFAEFGIERFLIGSAIRGIVAQRLARRLCPECKEPARLSGADLSEVRSIAKAGGYDLPADVEFQRPVGCDACRKRGFAGRIAIHELLEFTPAIREAFLKDASAERLNEIAVGEGMLTLVADGIRKAAAGMTTVDEVVRVTGKW